MKKPFLSSARVASFHTKHESIANVVQVVLDANTYLALSVSAAALVFWWNLEGDVTSIMINKITR
jgi:hypothetical protein